jgi:hypothetical protein
MPAYDYEESISRDKSSRIFQLREETHAQSESTISKPSTNSSVKSRMT